MKNTKINCYINNNLNRQKHCKHEELSKKKKKMEFKSKFYLKTR